MSILRRSRAENSVVSDVIWPKMKLIQLGPRWLSGRASDSGARGPGFEPYDRRKVSLSKTLKGSRSAGKYLGSGGSVPK